jgi:hypothetical protein
MAKKNVHDDTQGPGFKSITTFPGEGYRSRDHTDRPDQFCPTKDCRTMRPRWRSSESRTDALPIASATAATLTAFLPREPAQRVTHDLL